MTNKGFSVIHRHFRIFSKWNGFPGRKETEIFNSFIFIGAYTQSRFAPSQFHSTEWVWFSCSIRRHPHPIHSLCLRRRLLQLNRMEHRDSQPLSQAQTHSHTACRAKFEWCCITGSVVKSISALHTFWCVAHFTPPPPPTELYSNEIYIIVWSVQEND